MATTDIGRVTPIWRGFYSAATTYELNDLVIDNSGSVWWHKSEDQTTGVAPVAGEIWDAVIDMSEFSGLIQAAITTAQTALAAAQAALADVATDMERAETAAQNAENSATAASESAAGVGALAQAAAASAAAAEASETSASGSATSAAGSAEEAEAWATGGSGGTATATNNAKYYSEQSSASATSAASSASAAQDVLDSIPEDYSQLSGDVSDLKTQLNDINSPFVVDDYYPEMGMVIGGITSGGGTAPDTENTTPTRAKTRYIATTGSVVDISGPSGYYWSVVLYDINGYRIESIDYKNTTVTVDSVAKSAKYIRVVYKIGAAGTDSPDLTDFANNNYIKIYSHIGEIESQITSVDNKYDERTNNNIVDSTQQNISEKYIPNATVELGTVNNGQGQPDIDGTSTIRARTRYIATNGGMAEINIPTGYYVAIFGYNQNKIRTYDSGYVNVRTYVDTNARGITFLRLVFKKGSEGTSPVVLSEIAGTDVVILEGVVLKSKSNILDLFGVTNNSNYVPNAEVVLGGIANGSGNPDRDIGSTTRARTRYIATYGGKITVNAPEGYYVCSIGYDADRIRTYTKDYAVPPYSIDTENQNIEYIRFLYKIGSAGTAAINISDFNGVDVCTIKPKTTTLSEDVLYQPSATIRTIAHRGRWAPDFAPMCSKIAVIRAMQYGIKCVENDVAYSKDNHPVMWHDATFAILGNIKDSNGYLLYFDGNGLDYWYDEANENLYTFDYTTGQYVASAVDVSTLTPGIGANYGIGDINANVLYRIDIGSYISAKFKNQHIMSFEEWVKICHECGVEIYIDFKKHDISSAQAEELVDIVRNNGMIDYCSWLSNHYTIRSVLSNARILFVDENFPSDSTLETWATLLTGGRVGFDGSIFNATAENVSKVLQAGLECECWFANMQSNPPVSKENVYSRVLLAINAGVQAITLDYYKIEDAVRAKYAES